MLDSLSLSLSLFYRNIWFSIYLWVNFISEIKLFRVLQFYTFWIYINYVHYKQFKHNTLSFLFLWLSSHKSRAYIAHTNVHSFYYFYQICKNGKKWWKLVNIGNIALILYMKIDWQMCAQTNATYKRIARILWHNLPFVYVLVRVYVRWC